ncbi:hypothetical protein B0I32_103633 [Nonomuraea fuscirosea]|uniref:Uncharacterized protein n=2 Tax=Nonomuraea fuscirosea TaxID=1291556 RepID=A0A2T0N8C2_9ACTN|nr:hypothetical protein B0I32_103633 [Nonomuraea fuscirosea]
MSTMRQRSISGILVWANIIMLALVVISVGLWRWRFNPSSESITLFLCLWITSILLLLAASGLWGALKNYAEGLNTHPEAMSRTEPPMLSRIRKYLYYPGALLNFFAIAVLVESSGGLLYSPFSSVLLSMVLAAQQLGRFRTNSILFTLFGALMVAMVLVWETMFGVSTVPPPPPGLLFFILSISFGMAAVFNHVGKPPNPRMVTSHIRPTRVEIYIDGAGIWRYTVYGKRSRLDPIIEISERDGEVTLEEAKRFVADRAKTATVAAGGSLGGVQWRDFPDGAFGYIEP